MSLHPSAAISQVIAQRARRQQYSITPSALAKVLGCQLDEAVQYLLGYAHEVPGSIRPRFFLEVLDPYETKDISDLVTSPDALEGEGIEVDDLVWTEDPVVATTSNTYICFAVSKDHATNIVRAFSDIGGEEGREDERSSSQ